MARDPLLLAPNYALTAGLAILISLLFAPLTADMPGVQNRLGALFFACAYLAFSSMGLVEAWGPGGVERAVFVRERAGACYSLAIHYLSRTALDMVLLRAVPPLIYTVISYFWIGLWPDPSAFARHLLAMVLFTMATAGMLQALVLCVPSGALAALLATLYLLFSLLFGGFLLNKTRIRGIFRILPRLSPFNYGFEAVIVNELREISVRDDTVMDIDIPGRIILKQFGFDADAYSGDIVALLCMLLGGIVLGLVALATFVKEKR